MKKLVVFLICLFLYNVGYAGRVFPTCPNKEVICDKNEFPGDDGKCYSCNIDKGISAHCVYQKMKRLCPNRIYSFVTSYLNCPDNMEKVGEGCVNKCGDGYVRDGAACCKGDVCIIDQQ